MGCHSAVLGWLEEKLIACYCRKALKIAKTNKPKKKKEVKEKESSFPFGAPEARCIATDNDDKYWKYSALHRSNNIQE